VKPHVTDTHCIIWHLTRSRKLSRKAKQLFRSADDGHTQILVPTIVLVETAFIAQRQALPGDIVDWLFDLKQETVENYRLTPLDEQVVRFIRDFGPAAVPELADRIIAATARALDLPLLTADPVIASSELVQIVW